MWVVTRYGVTDGEHAFTVPNASLWNAQEWKDYIDALEHLVVNSEPLVSEGADKLRAVRREIDLKAHARISK